MPSLLGKQASCILCQYYSIRNLKSCLRYAQSCIRSSTRFHHEALAYSPFRGVMQTSSYAFSPKLSTLSVISMTRGMYWIGDSGTYQVKTRNCICVSLLRSVKTMIPTVLWQQVDAAHGYVGQQGVSSAAEDPGILSAAAPLPYHSGVMRSSSRLTHEVLFSKQHYLDTALSYPQCVVAITNWHASGCYA